MIYIYIYGVAEHWINLGFILYKNKKLDNSSENADMSNEKEIKNCSPKAYGIRLNLRPLRKS
jgi:hypothetical protein